MSGPRLATAPVAALLPAALALCACAVSQPQLPADAETVRAAARPGAELAAARGETDLIVRSFRAADAAQLAGASCRVETPNVTAEVTSPARVLMPYYGENTPAATVTCELAGMTGRTEALAETGWSRGAGGWPAVGVSVGTGGYNDGVGVGLGWYGGSYNAGEPSYRYAPADVYLQ